VCVCDNDILLRLDSLITHLAKQLTYHKTYSYAYIYCCDVGSIFHADNKAIPLQALTGPEGFWSLWLPDFKTIGT
jgi:hypothetical protein